MNGASTVARSAARNCHTPSRHAKLRLHAAQTRRVSRSVPPPSCSTPWHSGQMKCGNHMTSGPRRLPHRDQEVIAPRPEAGPAADAIVEPLESADETRVAGGEAVEIRWRRHHANPAHRD